MAESETISLADTSRVPVTPSHLIADPGRVAARDQAGLTVLGSIAAVQAAAAPAEAPPAQARAGHGRQGTTATARTSNAATARVAPGAAAM